MPSSKPSTSSTGCSRRLSTPPGGLETRRRYASDEQTSEWAQFTKGQRIDWDYDDDWCRKVRAQTERGKRYERVRLVDRPATPGQLYLRSNAARNCAVGEDIRNLSRADAEQLHLPDEDFWLFDSRLVARLLFDEDDILTGACQTARCRSSSTEGNRTVASKPSSACTCRKG